MVTLLCFRIITHDHYCHSYLSCSSWWDVVRHLIWSLLGLADSDKLGSADQTSLILLWLLYALFLVVVVILLVNMLIALLSNIYQGVEVTLSMS